MVETLGPAPPIPLTLEMRADILRQKLGLMELEIQRRKMCLEPLVVPSSVSLNPDDFQDGLRAMTLQPTPTVVRELGVGCAPRRRVRLCFDGWCDLACVAGVVLLVVWAVWARGL